MSAEEAPKGPLTRGEYERRHKELQDKYETFSHRVYRVLKVFFIGLLLTGGAAAYLIGENTERTVDINDSLIEGCQQNSNPLRATVRKFGGTLIEQTQAEIDESITLEKSGTYEEIFPNYPPAQLHKLLVRNRKEDRKTKRELSKAKNSVKSVNCKTRYPEPK